MSSRVFLEASCLSMFIHSHLAAVKVEISGKLLHQPGIPERNGSSVAALQALLCVSWGKRGNSVSALGIPAQAVVSLKDVLDHGSDQRKRSACIPTDHLCFVHRHLHNNRIQSLGANGFDGLHSLETL